MRAAFEVGTMLHYRLGPNGELELTAERPPATGVRSARITHVDRERGIITVSIESTGASRKLRPDARRNGQ